MIGWLLVIGKVGFGAFVAVWLYAQCLQVRDWIRKRNRPRL
jgi:hypothetical protein